MVEMHRPRVKYVIGPDGSPLTIADLPPPSTKRWVIRRKAEVVAAVRGGLLSLEEACSRYTLTVDEFLSWQMSIDQHGLAGLRTPESSITAKVVGNTFWTSIATDAGGNLVVEFLPSIVHRFPIMRKLRLE